MSSDQGTVLLGNPGTGTPPSLLQAFVANTGGDTYITVENRLSSPIYVTSAFQEGAPDSSVGISIPPLTIGTLPIEPDRGVIIACNQISPQTLQTSGNFLTRGCHPRNIPYRCHSEGGVGFQDLYPVESWVPAVLPTPLGGAAVQEFRVPAIYRNVELSGTLLCQNTPADTCIVAVTLEVNAVWASATQFMVLGPRYAVGAGGGGIEPQVIPIGASAGIGAVCTYAMRGAIYFNLTSSDLNATPLQGVAWLGIPASG